LIVVKYMLSSVSWDVQQHTDVLWNGIWNVEWTMEWSEGFHTL